jgi:hypothetical protein
MEHIKPGIYYEDAYLGVTLGALVTSHGTMMIDPPLRPEDARSWRSSLINQRGGSNRLLVLLDSHLDRTLGARTMESTIISHLQTAHTFSNRPAIFKGQSFESGSEWESYDDAIGTRWTIPNITFTEHMILHWGGVEVHLNITLVQRKAQSGSSSQTKKSFLLEMQSPQTNRLISPTPTCPPG